MALKLRRGTSTTRTNYTFAEGELVYTTDTKLLYVGDGVTPGGTLVTGSGGGGVEINGITDNTTEGTVVMTLGDALISLDTAVALGGDLDITNYQIDGDGDINITGDITAGGVGTGIITANSFVGDGSALTGITASGPFIGDLKGSVFADDSSTIIDGLDGSVNATTLTTAEINVEFSILNISDPASPNTTVSANIASDNNSSLLNLTREAQTDISGDTLPYGRISFTRDDSVGKVTTGFIQGGRDTIIIASDPSGTFSAPYNLIFQNGRFGVGALTPTVELDVVGDANISGTLTAGNIVSDATGTPEISSASDIIITANSGAGNFEVDSAKLLIDDVDLKAKLDLNIEGVVMMGKEASNDPTAFIPAVVNAPILSSIANDDTLDGTDRVKEVFRYRIDRYSSGGEILLAINDYDAASGADRFLVKKFLFHDSAGDGSAWTVTEIGTTGNAGLFTSLTVGLDNPGGGIDFFLTFTLRSPDAAISGASMLVNGQATFTSNPLTITVSGY